MLPQPRPNDALRGSLARNEGKLALPPELAGLDWFWGAQNTSAPTSSQERTMSTITFTKTSPPDWLLAMWKEIDEKTFGKGFDCFAENAVCNLGVADWHGREATARNCAPSSTKAPRRTTTSSSTWTARRSRSSTAKSR